MQRVVHSSKEFLDTLLKHLNFVASKQAHCTLYQNSNHPEHGYFLLYERVGYYSFLIGDYTIPKSFLIHFDNPQRMIRFGTVNQGIAYVQQEDQSISSFTPSSFFVYEEDRKGTQIWKQGTHYHGAEFTIYEPYFTQVIEKDLSTAFDYERFIKNFTYRYLPLDIISILETMQSLSNKGTLNHLFLESYLLQCIGVLSSTIEASPDNAFSNQHSYGKVNIGNHKSIHLHPQDIRSIQKAHDLLIEHLASPPTIERLSQLVLLNPQKLKAGFSYYYHMPIGQFITSRRMSMAANLLCTSGYSVSEIGKMVGYPYPSNFIKMFRQSYHCTPLEFRYQNRS